MRVINTVLDYTNTAAVGVGAVLEALVLYWFCRPLPFRFSDRARNVLILVLTAVCMMVLHYRYAPFFVQCPILLLIVLVYLSIAHDTNLKNVLLLGVVFIVAGEISHLFTDDILRNWVLASFFHLSSGTRESYFSLVLYTLILMALLRLLKGILFRNDRSKLRMREIMVPFLAFVPFFFLRVYQYTAVADGAASHELYIILIVSAALGLVLILSNEYFIYDHIDKSEMEKMQFLLETQREYYQLQEESIRAVNRNYHDLKHILNLLDAKGSEEAAEYLEQMKKDIAPYETVQNTGNRTLDILLSQKMQECQKEGIRVTAAVDGRALKFMNSMDLAVLFGNAMDNCMEAAGKVKDDARREIYVKVGEWSGQVLFRFENFYEGDEPDLTTSKEDKTMHGYGIRNMRSVACKYHGVLTCETQGGRFLLTIMLPEG